MAWLCSILINAHYNTSQLLLKRFTTILPYSALQQCVFQENTIQHFQFFIQPSSNCSIISSFIFFTLYICSIFTSSYVSVNTKCGKCMITYSIFLSLIALPSPIITTLTNFKKSINMQLIFPDSQRFNLSLHCSLH